MQGAARTVGLNRVGVSVGNSGVFVLGVGEVTRKNSRRGGHCQLPITMPMTLDPGFDVPSSADSETQRIDTAVEKETPSAM